MSVLIKGMTKPDMCGHCKFATAFDCMASGVFIKDHHKVNDDCPIVYIPPHGDLTDRDAYRDEFMNGVYELCSDDPDNNRANAIIDLFDNAPTIIPASGEGE